MALIEQTLQTTDPTRKLQIRLFNKHESKQVVVIAGAMGVPQTCYEKFALWLNEQGMSAITFDYYGMGASVDKPLKQIKTNMLQWGEYDCEAIIRFVRANYPDQTFCWVGHSVGGQLLGMTPSTNLIDKAITMASGSGYWRHNSPETKRFVWALWYGIAPLAVTLKGYFPGDRLNMVGDLPANAMRQWWRWCKNKDYAVGYEGQWLRDQFASVSIPITSISFSDDEMMSARNIENLHSFFTSSERKMIRINPKDIGEKRIGHLNWFRDKFRDSLWESQILPQLKNSTMTHKTQPASSQKICL
ncbi:MAG: alpha/beta hydrolase [Thalassolituus sp.]|nr:MAG: alpha/beta hydrolase [Thalassolituus sp.]TNC92225.1 MAG: alpha/beta hydrolase [Thalassolituus sp.]TPD54921.1 MAG: alpha/beta hydrolase [Thalassolituus maritimus]